MPKMIDLTGQRFGRLTVLGIGRRRDRAYLWACRCDCGQTRVVASATLRGGRQVSCGCLKNEKARARIKHGLTRKGKHHPLYNLWADMRARCHNPSEPAFPNYGGRGIVVDPRWEDFAAFVVDMGERPTGMTLERIDNDGPYSPSNCRWATRGEQANNRRSNVFLTHEGRTQTIAQWAREARISVRAMWERTQYLGWSMDRAMAEPPRAIRPKGSKIR